MRRQAISASFLERYGAVCSVRMWLRKYDSPIYVNSFGSWEIGSWEMHRHLPSNLGVVKRVEQPKLGDLYTGLRVEWPSLLIVPTKRGAVRKTRRTIGRHQTTGLWIEGWMFLHWDPVESFPYLWRAAVYGLFRLGGLVPPSITTPRKLVSFQTANVRSLAILREDILKVGVSNVS